MIRESLSKREAAVQNGFRLRGLKDVSRVEALSDGLALTNNPFSSLLAGLSYWLIGPIQYFHGSYRGKSRKRLEHRLAHTEAAPLQVPADI